MRPACASRPVHLTDAGKRGVGRTRAAAIGGWRAAEKPRGARGACPGRDRELGRRRSVERASLQAGAAIEGPAHAELLVVRRAAEALGRWRLDDVTVVVTLEPCTMCAGALLGARVARVVFGADDPKAGACGSLYNVFADPRLNHEIPLRARVRAAECGELLTSFFLDRRG